MNQATQITFDTRLEPSFDTFDPRGYLNEYYSSIDFENNALLKFYVDCYKNMSPTTTLLEFGGGPTIYASIAAAPKVKEIHFCDCVNANLEEVKLWKNTSTNAFNWNLFIQRVLEHEGIKHITLQQIENRAELLRKKLTTFLYCDAFQKQPLGYKSDKLYDIVQTNFVAESVTTSKKEWRNILKNITSLIKPGGTLILSAIKNSSYYHIDKKRFPAVSVNEEDLVKTLKRLGFDKLEIVRTIDANKPYRGYDGFIFIKARRNY